MYELIKVTENSFFIDCPTKIGIVKLSDNEVMLIDSGNDKDAGKKILKVLNENSWKLKMIVNTHSHADHVGGNRYLYEQTGCKIYAPEKECPFIKNTLLEPSFLFGAYPMKALRGKFLMAKETEAEPLREGVLPEGFEIIDLPGHSFSMVGIKTPDNVFYIGDCLSAKETLDKYKILYLYDVEQFINTLEEVRRVQAKMFIPSHAAASEDISLLAEYNVEKVKEIADKIKEICAVPLCFEDLLKELFDEYERVMTAEQYVLVGSTVRSYLSYLYDRGEITTRIENNKFLWETV
jgi:glyoxylase-like metal-dependent hydrolase (beta-lactamase superfamily II)